MRNSGKLYANMQQVVVKYDEYPDIDCIKNMNIIYIKISNK